MCYPCSENKGTDQLGGYCEADQRLCFRIGKRPVFSQRGSISLITSSQGAEAICKILGISKLILYQELLGHKKYWKIKLDVGSVMRRSRNFSQERGWRGGGGGPALDQGESRFTWGGGGGRGSEKKITFYKSIS